jgi:hypothetical protein
MSTMISAAHPEVRKAASPNEVAFYADDAAFTDDFTRFIETNLNTDTCDLDSYADLSWQHKM